jgi:hypothetical protein
MGRAGGAADQLDAAIAITIGERGENLSLDVIRLLGRAAGFGRAVGLILVGAMGLAVDVAGRRKAMFNLKDEEAGLLKVVGGPTLAGDPLHRRRL